MTDAGLAALAGLMELHTLGLSGTAVTDGGLAALHSLPNLRRLWLSDTEVTRNGVLALRRALPALQFVDYPGREQSFEADPVAGPRFPRIEALGGAGGYPHRAHHQTSHQRGHHH